MPCGWAINKKNASSERKALFIQPNRAAAALDIFKTVTGKGRTLDGIVWAAAFMPGTGNMQAGLGMLNAFFKMAVTRLADLERNGRDGFGSHDKISIISIFLSTANILNSTRNINI